jgi:transcriptional regulator CtsR
MDWIQFGLLVVANFASVLVGYAVIRNYEMRKKRKFVNAFLDDMEQKISTEIKFGDIVKQFDEEDK